MNCCNCSVEIPENSAFCMKCAAKQNVENIDDQIDSVEKKLSVTNHSFSAKGRLDCQQWIKEFGFDEVCQAIDIALKQYLRFDEDDNPLKHTVNTVFSKIPGICANRKTARKKPYMADTLRMVGYANKKFRLDRSMEKDYKEHIERILYILFSKNDNYSDLYESFFWKLKAAKDEWEFLEEMNESINILEQGGKIV